MRVEDVPKVIMKLANAPSTLQVLMDDVFRPHLRNFFFEDILVVKIWKNNYSI